MIATLYSWTDFEDLQTHSRDLPDGFRRGSGRVDQTMKPNATPKQVLTLPGGFLDLSKLFLLAG